MNNSLSPLEASICLLAIERENTMSGLLMGNDPWCYGSWYSCLGKNRDCMYDEQCRADSDPCSGRSCDECEIGGCDHGTM
jgi:hypothetical protein